jgi:hypothetical protein
MVIQKTKIAELLSEIQQLIFEKIKIINGI